MPSLWGLGTYGTGAYSAITDADLVGDVNVSILFSGDLLIAGQVDFSGDLPVGVLMEAQLTGDVPFNAGMQISIQFAVFELHSGPLWAPIEPCSSPDWAETELCDG